VGLAHWAPPAGAEVDGVPASEVLVAAHENGVVAFWHAQPERRERRAQVQGPAFAASDVPVCLLPLPDGCMAMGGHARGEISLWDLVRCALLRTIGPKESRPFVAASIVHQLSLTPENWLAAVTADGCLRLWEHRGGACMVEIPAPAPASESAATGASAESAAASNAATALSDGRLLVGAASGRLSELTPQGDGSYVCTRTVDLPGCAWRLWQLADGIIAAVDVRQQLRVTLLWPGDLSGAMPLDVRGLFAGCSCFGVAVTPAGGLVAVSDAGGVECWSPVDIVGMLIPPLSAAAPAVPALLGRVSDSDASEASKESCETGSIEC